MPQLDNAYRELAQLAPTDVVLDLAEVTFLGGVALRLVTRITTRHSPTGHKLVIQSPSQPARRLLELTGFWSDSARLVSDLGYEHGDSVTP